MLRGGRRRRRRSGCETVAQHHERPDGTGYPAGLREVGELPHRAALHRRVHGQDGAACAACAAVRRSSPRASCSRSRGGAPASAAIIKEFGIYPPGEFVQLKSGEMAVVVRRSARRAHARWRPASPTGRACRMVNTVMRDTAKPEFAIAGAGGRQERWCCVCRRSACSACRSEPGRVRPCPGSPPPRPPSPPPRRRRGSSCGSA